MKVSITVKVQPLINSGVFFIVAEEDTNSETVTQPAAPIEKLNELRRALRSIPSTIGTVLTIEATELGLIIADIVDNTTFPFELLRPDTIAFGTAGSDGDSFDTRLRGYYEDEDGYRYHEVDPNQKPEINPQNRTSTIEILYRTPEGTDRLFHLDPNTVGDFIEVDPKLPGQYSGTNGTIQYVGISEAIIDRHKSI